MLRLLLIIGLFLFAIQARSTESESTESESTESESSTDEESSEEKGSFYCAGPFGCKKCEGIYRMSNPRGCPSSLRIYDSNADCLEECTMAAAAMKEKELKIKKQLGIAEFASTQSEDSSSSDSSGEKQWYCTPTDDESDIECVECSDCPDEDDADVLGGFFMESKKDCTEVCFLDEVRRFA